MFSYCVSDGAYTATAAVTLTVAPIGDPPAIDSIDAQVVDELVTLSFLVTATDPDPGDTLTFAIEPGAPAGAAIDPATGEFAWTPDEAQGPGVYTVTVVVTDSGVPPLGDSVPFTVTVHEVNLPPAAEGDAYTVDHGTPLTVTAPGVLANDLDPDLPAQVLTVTLQAGPFYGDLVLAPDGGFVYTPVLSVHGVDTFTYTLSDGELSAGGVVTLTVSAADRHTIYLPLVIRNGG
ncbi:MAG: cadherin-like domain-containing protein [Anaerolineae bacterium]|nr:cadherin-like domain-containing protein [Anaerolineae bacterium]